MNEPVGVTQVRWMGMIVAVFIMLLGGFLALSGTLLAVMMVATAVMPDKQPPPAMLWAALAMQLGMGVPVFLYGKSMFIRARTDTSVTATVTLNDEPRHRTLAWLAAGFSSLMLFASLGILLTGLRSGKIASGSLNGFWFALMLVAAVRNLRKHTTKDVTTSRLTGNSPQ